MSCNIELYKKTKASESKNFPMPWYFLLSRLDIFHENVPNGDDVADTTCQYKEMEHGMHVFFLVDTVEHSTRDVANTFCNNPPDCGWGNRIDKRLEGNENWESHAYKAKCL